MIKRHNDFAAKLRPGFKNLAVNFADALYFIFQPVFFQQERHGKISQGADYFGIDDFNLPLQIRRAGGNFFRLGIAIARRPVLKNVADINLLSLDSRRRQKLV